MARLTWDLPGDRRFETGIDRGVLYTAFGAVAWNGITAVTEKNSGAKPVSNYVDGVKVWDEGDTTEYSATLEAFTYPDEFSKLEGSFALSPYGFDAYEQPPGYFGLSYRTIIGNDISSVDHAYKIHILYKALAAPNDFNYGTLSESVETDAFSWDISASPVNVPGGRRSAHFTIDSSKVSPGAIRRIENVLYGTDGENARLPTIEEIQDILEEFQMLPNLFNNPSFEDVSANTVLLYKNQCSWIKDILTYVEVRRNLITTSKPSEIGSTGYNSEWFFGDNVDGYVTGPNYVELGAIDYLNPVSSVLFNNSNNTPASTPANSVSTIGMVITNFNDNGDDESFRIKLELFNTANTAIQTTVFSSPKLLVNGETGFVGFEGYTPPGARGRIRMTLVADTNYNYFHIRLFDHIILERTNKYRPFVADADLEFYWTGTSGYSESILRGKAPGVSVGTYGKAILSSRTINGYPTARIITPFVPSSITPTTVRFTTAPAAVSPGTGKVLMAFGAVSPSARYRIGVTPSAVWGSEQVISPNTELETPPVVSTSMISGPGRELQIEVWGGEIDGIRPDFWVAAPTFVYDYLDDRIPCFNGDTIPIDTDLACRWSGSTSEIYGKAIPGLGNVLNAFAIKSSKWVEEGSYSLRLIPKHLTNFDSFASFSIPSDSSVRDGGTMLATSYVETPQVGASEYLRRIIDVVDDDENRRTDPPPNTPVKATSRRMFDYVAEGLAEIRLYNGGVLNGGDVFWDLATLVDEQYSGPGFVDPIPRP